MPPFDSRELGRLPGSALDVVAYRNQAKGFDPRSGEGARRFGGRFNPPNSFPVLYLCLTQPCVVAELTRQAERQSLSVEDLLPRELWKILVRLDKVLDLSDSATLASLNIDAADLTRDHLAFTQDVGEATHEHGFQAVRCPSATDVGEVLAIFPENLAGAVLRVELAREWLTIDDVAP